MFPGFTLPDELRILGDQVRRFVQEEIIPLEQRLDPDAPDIPREDFLRHCLALVPPRHSPDETRENLRACHEAFYASRTGPAVNLAALEASCRHERTRRVTASEGFGSYCEDCGVKVSA